MAKYDLRASSVEAHELGTSPQPEWLDSAMQQGSVRFTNPGWQVGAASGWVFWQDGDFVILDDDGKTLDAMPGDQFRALYEPSAEE